MRDVSLDGISGISEPTVEPVDYTNVPSGRDYEAGKPLVTADRAGGFNGKTATASTKTIDTQRDSDPFVD